ncbi:glycosyltransferase family 4 protein [Thermodesulfobacteriota bacterium]
MKIAIIQDWLVTYAGSERVLEQIINIYPDADLYSLVDFLPEGKRGFIKNKEVNTSFIQKLPFAKKKYRGYLPFMPLAIEQFDLSEYDLIISSSHAVAKGVLTSVNQIHVCYCHTPIRYAWDLYHQYLKEAGLTKGLKAKLAKLVLHYIRIWDSTTANRVDKFIANSAHTAKRIKKIYDRDAVVIYPPVDVDGSELVDNKDDFYFTASRMVPYKKIDLIVEAFSKMPDKKLIVIGDGPDFKKVSSKAGSNVKILGYQPNDVLADHMKRAKAFLFAAEEDFGIIPVEAQSYGTPVIAYAKGGALETVVDGKTGLFFDKQTPDSLVSAIARFEAEINTFDSKVIKDNSESFSNSRFMKEFEDFINGLH